MDKAGYRGFMKHIFSTLLTFLFFIAAGFAHAADPFTVAGIAVDATGETPIEAQTLAIRDGQARAANILLERLTVESERLAKGAVPVSEDNAAKMIRAMEIDNEKRSATRYLGDITVAFNPSAMQAVVDPESDWFKAWENSGAQHALTPIRALSADQAASLASSAFDVNAVKQIGTSFGVQQVLIADDLGGFVKVTDVALDSSQRQEFSVNGGPLAVISQLENDWKQASVSVAASAVEMPISILYSSHSEWLRLKEAINGSAQIQDARLDALSKDGALMTITYGGDINRLRNELAFKGVDVREDPSLGVVLGRTGSF